MAMKAMKVAKKSTAMKAAKAAKAAAPPKSTAMKAAKVAAPPTAMKKQATKFKHTTWTYINALKIPTVWVRIDSVNPNVRVTCYKELDPMVAIK